MVSGCVVDRGVDRGGVSIAVAGLRALLRPGTKSLEAARVLKGALLHFAVTLDAVQMCPLRFRTASSAVW